MRSDLFYHFIMGKIGPKFSHLLTVRPRGLTLIIYQEYFPYTDICLLIGTFFNTAHCAFCNIETGSGGVHQLWNVFSKAFVSKCNSTEMNNNWNLGSDDIGRLQVEGITFLGNQIEMRSVTLRGYKEGA